MIAALCVVMVISGSPF